MCVFFGLVEGVWFGEAQFLMCGAGCHRAGQTKAFPPVTSIGKAGPNDMAGRMAQKGARPRVRPIKKVAPAELDGALWPARGRRCHFECHLGRLGAFLAFLGGILALGHLL